MSIQRREFIKTATGLCILPASIAGIALSQEDARTSVYEGFPSQDPARVREMVGASHGRIERVRELLAESPALAKATWDWGFGDWETAIGAASHVGNREIARLLMENGARPDLFTFAMLGQLDVVTAYVSANPGIQRTRGPHGITLLQHARAGGEQSKHVVEYLERVGDADIGQTPLPLSDEEKQVYTGDYSAGTLTLRIDLDKNGHPRIGRIPDGAPRALFHLGNHEFHPTGASAVRIKFDVSNGRATSLTLIDGRPMLTALRV